MATPLMLASFGVSDTKDTFEQGPSHP